MKPNIYSVRLGRTQLVAIHWTCTLSHISFPHLCAHVCYLGNQRECMPVSPQCPVRWYLARYYARIFSLLFVLQGTTHAHCELRFRFFRSLHPRQMGTLGCTQNTLSSSPDVHNLSQVFSHATRCTPPNNIALHLAGYCAEHYAIADPDLD